MKRQQSFQDKPSKRRCPAQQLAMEAQGNQPQVNQWPSNSGQPWGYFPQQPTQQHYYYNTDNSSNNTTAFLPNNCYGATGEFASMQYAPIQYTPPMQYCPMQFTPAQLPPAQLPSAQLPSARLARVQITPEQIKAFSSHLNMTGGGDYTSNNILPPHPTHVPNYPVDRNITTQNIQPNISQFCPIPQPQYQFEAPQQRLEPRRPFRCSVDMPGMPTGINATYNPPIGGNIPGKVPIHIPEHYRPGSVAPAIKRNPSKSQDTYGVDLTTLHRPQPIVDLTTLSRPEPTVDLTTTGRSKPTPQNEERTNTVSQFQNPPGSRENQQGKTNHLQRKTPDPYDGLGPIVDWLKVEKQHEIESEKERIEKEREEAERLAQATQWSGDQSEYPAECYEHLRLPGCEFRAQAICVGSPRPEWLRAKGRLVVYAVRRPNSDGVEFKLVKSGSSVKEVMESPEILFRDISLSGRFSDMDELKVAQWSRYLLAAVPGTADSLTMWAKA
ncbi:hypothetical protein E0Z10_g4178 [Xylaria hypoxylon]|uniref:Uncharacterized protein n=1 Tax=Xylaria hypoxylon TaxID=37992 RepID=A0A4Z0Z1G7_9PEZI|nr:hypothetical protein E0Z10_g4178 [Xylaria hypoxylon]